MRVNFFRQPFSSQRLPGRRGVLQLGLVALLLGVASPAPNASAHAGAEPRHWVGTWSASPMAADAAGDQTNDGFSNQTLRQIAHVSIGGDRVRVRLSNAFGTTPLVIGAAHVALQSDAAAIVPESDRALSFAGQPSVVIPPGALVLSDAVELAVPSLGNLAVSVFVPEETGPTTWHQLGTQSTFVSAPGDFTAAAELPIAAVNQSWFWLSGIEVQASRRAFSVVTLGDSITDGYGSTLDANRRWPDLLSARLNAAGTRARHAPVEVGVLNQGISGNRLLHDQFGQNASARFDRDVLAAPGARHVIVMIGINDLGFPGAFGVPDEAVEAADIQRGLGFLVERAHAQGLRIHAATLAPFEGTSFPGYYTLEGEAKRQAINAWVRDSNTFDSVIDFDAVLRDPARPTQLLPAFDSGDHLHPNDAGYAAMANAIDLGELR
ncbi:MAG TPA: SGNH/GDSL hydrolase family protein [Polyangiaceae bacterium]|nr:SGNH/GDSL hydrolase family protein [Polyangiaceae bacterium]